MQRSVFRKKALLLAMAAAQMMLAQQALAAESNTVSTNQSTRVDVQEAHTTYDVQQGVVIRVIRPVNGAVSVGNIIDTFTNAGQIMASNGAGSSPLIGLNVESHITTLINKNYINADSAPDSVGLKNTGVIDTLQNNGSIVSTIGIQNLGQVGSLYNTAEIYGETYAFRNAGSLSSYTSVYNTGSISSNTGIAISNSTPIYLIDNTGSIVGMQAAIDSSSQINYINNRGTIKGDINYNHAFSMTLNGDDRGVAFQGLFTGFGNDTIGTIYSPNADLLLGHGRIGMNDNIDLAGTHSLINQGATLRVWQPITINGNYVQKEDATLDIGVNGNPVAAGLTTDTGYGRLTVSGSANLASGSNVLLSRNSSPYPFASGQRYLVIVANDSGTEYNTSTLHYGVENYNGIATGVTILDPSNGTRSLAIYLDDAQATTPPDTTTPPGTTTPPETTTPTNPGTPPVTTTPTKPNPPVVSIPRPGRGFASTRNAVSSLNGLSGYSGFSDGLLNLYNASMAIGNREEANKAGEQLSPVQNSAASSTASAASLDALAVVSNHIDSVRLARNSSVQRGIATGDDPLEWAVWGQPFYGNVRQGMIDNVSGYSAHYGGLVLGTDRQVAEHWRAGGALTYSHSSVRGSDFLTGNHTDVDAWGGVAYASWTGSPWYVNLSASLTRQQYESQRAIAFEGFSGQAAGKFNGLQMVTKAEVGYPLLFDEGTTLTPLAAMSYSYMHQDAYQEHSDSGAALDVNSNHSQSVRHSLGGKLEHSWMTPAGDLVPFVQAMWTHEYDRSRTANSASYVADTQGETRFTSFGATPVGDTADISAGVTLVQSDDLSVSARYDLSTAPHFDAQTVSLRLRKLF